ncbi:MAG: efflux transporter periplasmic adaptor subunit [Cellvibrionales bacterium TMED49]|nr:efflux transporter periplasmic adaptor subunit [Porticoccaceae bacterium]OUU39909.1 MAG: efflux transporter periplasmic adaptor subunit [Cellvibrionales bacterium TMED49]
MRSKFVAVAILLASVAIGLFMNSLRGTPPKVPAPEAAIAVKTERLHSKDIELYVISQGTVQPSARTTLISEATGTVVQISEQFVVGGTFVKGDILMQLDTTNYDVALQRAKAKLISAQGQLELENARVFQAKKEWEITGRPNSEAPPLALRKPFLLEAQANNLEAEAEVKYATIKLNQTTLRAPYSGMVSRKLVGIGQYVTQGSPVAELFATDFSEVRLPLTEKDLSTMGGIPEGVASKRSVVALRGSINGANGQWNGQIVRSEGVVDQTNRAQYLVVQVDDPYNLKPQNKNSGSLPLLVGTFVEVTLPGRLLEDVFLLPSGGLRKNIQVATVDSEDRLRLNPVSIAFSDDNYFYVSSGLEEGAEVITSALGVPIEGLRVAVTNRASSDSGDRK